MTLQVENGNHNWVEVWDHREEAWHFIEATPAGGQCLYYFHYLHNIYKYL